MPIPIQIPTFPQFAGWNTYFVVYGPASSVATATEVYVDGEFVENTEANRNAGGIDLTYNNGFFVGEFPEDVPAGTYPFMGYRRMGAENDTANDPTLLYDIAANQLTFVGMSRLLQACQKVTEEIDGLLAEDMTVDFVYTLDFPDPDMMAKDADLLAEFSGKRKVYVSPLEEQLQLATNSEDYANLSMVVTILERYDGNAITPPTAWVHERISWVESSLFDMLSNPRKAVNIVHNAHPLKEACIIRPYNHDYLQQMKLYYGEIVLTYRQLVDSQADPEAVAIGSRSYYAWWFGGGAIVME